MQAFINRDHIHDPEFCLQHGSFRFFFRKDNLTVTAEECRFERAEFQAEDDKYEGKLESFHNYALRVSRRDHVHTLPDFPGKTGHYPVVRGQYHTLQDALMD